MRLLRTVRAALPTMRVWWFYPLLFLTVVITLFTIFKNRRTTPGAIFWELPKRVCDLSRFWNYSSAWLMCEGNDGFVIAHWMHPFILAYYWGAPGVVAWIAFYFEAGEAFTSSNFHSFVFTASNVVTQETLPGSVLGDAAINGQAAVLLAIAASQFTNWNGVFGHGVLMPIGYYVKYVLVGLPFSLMFIASPLESDGFRWGIFLILMVDFFLIMVWVPFWMTPDEVPGYNLLREYLRAVPIFLFTLVVLATSELLPLVMANPWYQTWSAGFGLLFIYKLLLLTVLRDYVAKTSSPALSIDAKSGKRELRNPPNEMKI
jgi:hypothetical protein